MGLDALNPISKNVHIKHSGSSCKGLLLFDSLTAHNVAQNWQPSARVSLFTQMFTKMTVNSALVPFLNGALKGYCMYGGKTFTSNCPHAESYLVSFLLGSSRLRVSVGQGADCLCFIHWICPYVTSSLRVPC